jgi:hypothetical protein
MNNRMSLSCYVASAITDLVWHNPPAWECFKDDIGEMISHIEDRPATTKEIEEGRELAGLLFSHFGDRLN